MRLLLDTHIWIWSAMHTQRIAKSVQAALSRAENGLWLSPVSVWETISLADRGRIDMGGDPADVARQWLNEAPMADAALTREVAILSRRIELGTTDPADRFLAATAVVHDLILVTSDRALIDSPSVPTLANS